MTFPPAFSTLAVIFSISFLVLEPMVIITSLDFAVLVAFELTNFSKIFCLKKWTISLFVPATKLTSSSFLYFLPFGLKQIAL